MPDQSPVNQPPVDQQTSSPRRTPIASAIALIGAAVSFAATFVFLQRGRGEEIIKLMLVTAAGIILLLAGVTGLQRNWYLRNPERPHSGISTKIADGVMCFIASLVGTFMGLCALLQGVQLLITLEPGLERSLWRFERFEQFATSLNITPPEELAVQTLLVMAISIFLFWYAVTTVKRIALS